MPESRHATSFSGIYSDTLAQIQPELLAGESLLWSGQPLRKIIFHQRDLFTIPFSLLWGGFAIFWEWGATGHFRGSASSHPAPTFFTLWGIPFVLMGQYLIWGRFLYTAWKKGRTYYAVTNRRVIVVSIGFSRTLIDGYLRNLDSASLTLRSDGIGTIEFASARPALSNWSFGRSNRGNQIDIDLSSLAFFDIPDARTVYQLIQSQREQAAKPAD
ncbi:MAG: hypothetical protein WBX19_20890 [Terracidiphilus sp.]